MSGQWWENDLIVGPFADIPAANAWAAANPSSLFPGLLATAAGAQIRWNGSEWAAAENGTNRKIAIFGNSITAQSKPFCAYDTLWKESIEIAINAYRNPVMIDLSGGYAPLRYKCTTAGITGATEPIWPIVAGGTVQDGTVTWTAEAPLLNPGWGYGSWSVAQALMGQPFDEIAIVGASSRESPFILSYLPRVLALNPGVVYFANVWENDIGMRAASLTQIMERFAVYVSAVRAAQAHGCHVIVQTCLPSGFTDCSGTAFVGYVSGAYTKAWSWLNQQIRALAAGDSTITLVDVSGIYIDPNPANPVWPDNSTTYGSPTGAGQQLKATDGVHPYAVANYAIANVIKSAVLPKFPAVARFQPASQANQVYANPLNYGSGGTLGSNTTGAVPNNATVNITGTGASGVASAVARSSESGNWCRVAASVASGSGRIEFRNSSSIPAGAFVSEGNVWQSFFEMRLHSISALHSVACQLNFGGSPIFAASTAFFGGSSDQYIDSKVPADTVLVLKTVPVKIPPGAVNIQWSVFASYYGTVSEQIDFGRIAIGRCAIPALA